MLHWNKIHSILKNWIHFIHTRFSLKSCVLCYVPDLDYRRQSDFTRNLKSKVYWSDKQGASENVVFPDWRLRQPKYSAVHRHVSSSAQGCWVSAQGCRIQSTTVNQYVDVPAPGCRVSTQGCQIRSTAIDTHVQSPTQGCRVPAQGCWVPTNSSNPTSGPFHHPRATSTPKMIFHFSKKQDRFEHCFKECSARTVKNLV